MGSATLAVNVTYDQLYKEPRQRKYRLRSAAEQITLTAPATDRADAPLVLTAPHELDSYALTSHPTVEYRLIGGRLHAAHWYKDDTHTWRPSTLKTYIDRHQHLILGYKERQATSASIITARLNKALSDGLLTLIDGHVYLPCDEPVYTVEECAKIHSVEYGTFDPDGRASAFHGTAVFRADAYADALAHARSLTLAGDNDPDRVSGISEPATVHRPDLLRYGAPRTFLIPVEIKGVLHVPVTALHATQARESAEEIAEEIAAPLLTGVTTWTQRGGTCAPPPPQTVRLTLPDFQIRIDHTDLHVTHPRGNAHVTLATPGTAATAAAAALLILADPDSVPIPDRVSLLRNLNGKQQTRLERTLPRGVSLAQRAARGLLHPTTLDHLIHHLETALHEVTP